MFVIRRFSYDKHFQPNSAWHFCFSMKCPCAKSNWINNLLSVVELFIDWPGLALTWTLLNTFRMNWGIDCEPDHITQYQCLTLLMYMKFQVGENINMNVSIYSGKTVWPSTYFWPRTIISNDIKIQKWISRSFQDLFNKVGLFVNKLCQFLEVCIDRIMGSRRWA